MAIDIILRRDSPALPASKPHFPAQLLLTLRSGTYAAGVVCGKLQLRYIVVASIDILLRAAFKAESFEVALEKDIPHATDRPHAID